MTTSTVLNWAIAGCLVGIVYILMLNLIDHLQERPLKVMVVAPVPVEGSERIRQELSNVAHQVFTGTSLLAEVMRRTDKWPK